MATRPCRRTPRTCPREPDSPYAIAKHSVEQYLLYYRRVHGLRAVAVGFSNVYGPRQDPHGEAGVVAIFCGRLHAGKPLTIFGDGNQTRDYVYVGDVADAMLRASQYHPPKGAGMNARASNIGTGVATSVVDLASILMTAAGRTVPSVRPGASRRAPGVLSHDQQSGGRPRLASLGLAGAGPGEHVRLVDAAGPHLQSFPRMMLGTMQLGGATPNGALDLITSATISTQIVLGVLAVLSLLSWAVMFGAWRQLAKAEKAALKFQHAFENAPRLDEAGALVKRSPAGALPRLFLRAMHFVSETRIRNRQATNWPISSRRRRRVGRAIACPPRRSRRSGCCSMPRRRKNATGSAGTCRGSRRRDRRAR